MQKLRAEMADDGLDAFLVPRGDAHQGEYVAPSDERLAWLTGFTGSAGFAAVLTDRAAVFADGRYTIQLRAQIDPQVFEPVDWPGTLLSNWLCDALSPGDLVGFDPWLHTVSEIEDMREKLSACQVEMTESLNLIDRIWPDRPGRPTAPVTGWPIELAGQAHRAKRDSIAADMVREGHKATVLTLTDSVAWLLNIRGGDVPRTPVALAFAILYNSGRAELFVDPAKTEGLEAHLGPNVKVVHPDQFEEALRQLEGPVCIDPARAPHEVARILAEARTEIVRQPDPVIARKAVKNAAEIAATTDAHLRDGVAMCRFLRWLDRNTETMSGTAPLTEIDVVQALEGFRHGTGELRDVSFDTIAGAGPNGAIVHYRVTDNTNRPLARGELLLVDSGGQYLDGTTDVTRTMAIGQPSAEHRACFTRVLQGMIAVCRTRFPRGLTGRDLDALARAPLWNAGQDYDHGTGHGVGVYLSVHEGPQGISRKNMVPLEPGMIISDEPGYYRAGAFGIRIENLVLVEEAPELDSADTRDMLSFRTLTLVPIDRRLINTAMLSNGETEWLNGYHDLVRKRLTPLLGDETAGWLAKVTRPI